jgi:hypothetical protein
MNLGRPLPRRPLDELGAHALARGGYDHVNARSGPDAPDRCRSPPRPPPSPARGADRARCFHCANCGAAMDERKCKLICTCGYFLSCSDYY